MTDIQRFDHYPDGNDGSDMEPTDLGDYILYTDHIAALEAENATACPCTTIQQDESCPVGYPSLLCEVCDGKGILPTALEAKTDWVDIEDRREQKLATIVAPDNGTPYEVLSAVLECAKAWVPEARIIGNVRAGDIARAIDALEANQQVIAPLNVDAMARDLLEAELKSSERHVAELKEEFGKSRQVIETLRAALVKAKVKLIKQGLYSNGALIKDIDAAIIPPTQEEESAK